MSALKTRTAYLCVGQHFTDESLFNPKVIHACICIPKRGARRPQDKTVRCLCMHTYFPPRVLFLTRALVFEQAEKEKKKNDRRRRTGEIWLIQKALSWIDISGISIHMFTPQTRLFRLLAFQPTSLPRSAARVLPALVRITRQLRTSVCSCQYRMRKRFSQSLSVAVSMLKFEPPPFSLSLSHP